MKFPKTFAYVCVIVTASVCVLCRKSHLHQTNTQVQVTLIYIASERSWRKENVSEEEGAGEKVDEEGGKQARKRTSKATTAT